MKLLNIYIHSDLVDWDVEFFLTHNIGRFDLILASFLKPSSVKVLSREKPSAGRYFLTFETLTDQ